MGPELWEPAGALLPPPTCVCDFGLNGSQIPRLQNGVTFSSHVLRLCLLLWPRLAFVLLPVEVLKGAGPHQELMGSMLSEQEQGSSF